MNEPQIKLDHCYHRPINHVVGLLTEKSQIPAISSELESAGAAILDEHGRYHGLPGRIVRAL